MRIAVLVPCRDEQETVGDVVEGFTVALPGASIYVYDNASSDGTASRAEAAGAIVRTESALGKGSVVRRMFADVDADVYVMADGDGTYDPSEAPVLVGRLLDHRLDMVIGARTPVGGGIDRPGHAAGNRLFNAVYRLLFGTGFSDILSGYRAFSRRFVKTFPAVSSGFEIETEMSVHASQLQLPVEEVRVAYRPRPEGSVSKLRTFADGTRILRAMVVLLKDNRPAALFGVIAGLLGIGAVVLAAPLVVGFAQTGLVERLPTAVLAMGIAVIALVSAVSGMVLDSVAKARLEAKRLAYLVQSTRTGSHDG